MNGRVRSAGATRREDAIAYNAGYSHTRASTCNPRSTPPNPPRNTTINPFVPPSSCAADGSRVRVSSAMSRLRSSPQVTARCCTACVAAARDTPPAAVTPHVVAPPPQLRLFGHRLPQGAPMDRWRNRRSATSFRYEILWEVPNFWVGFFLVSRGMVGSVTRFHICPLSWKFFF